MYWLDGFILVGVAFTCVGALKKDLKTTSYMSVEIKIIQFDHIW